VSNYFILPFFCIFSIELFVRINALVFVHKMYEKFSSFAKLMSAKHISDHWKEVVIPVYALIIIINALKFLGVLLLIVGMFTGLVLFFTGFFQFAISLSGMLEMLVFSLIYLKIR
tara:strand:+ start:1662 stop:2006 length:345 start_codon:yes stop_codon:yes gene_type:complete